MSRKGPRYVGAIDQGTTSTRFLLFDRQARIAASHQLEHRQIYPRPGWVEHDAWEIWERTAEVVRAALGQAGAAPEELAAVGITNQRETVVAWDRETGRPLANAVVWQDTRTAELVARLAAEGGSDRFRERTGLPLSTYFSGPKLSWLLENDSGLARAAEEGRALFGTMDSWLVWQLTGGSRGGVHVTDPSNASRTMMMDIETLSWDRGMLGLFGLRQETLPRILPSVPQTPYGLTAAGGPLGGEVPVAGILGDQQAALFGQACFLPGSSKNTYGTGCFLLLNTGAELVRSRHGLITTVACQRGGEPPAYALEGSVAVTGALVQWLRDNLGLIASSSEIEALAGRVEDCGGVYFVPAFSGLFAPYWRSDARGVIVGLSGYTTGAHIARAALEATAFQTREIFEAMEEESGMSIRFLKVDGGMTVNELLMQFQADLLDVPVIRPRVRETTALGAAFAAGLCAGFWKDTGELASLWEEERRWTARITEAERRRRLSRWRKAVERSFGWEE